MTGWVEPRPGNVVPSTGTHQVLPLSAFTTTFPSPPPHSQELNQGHLSCAIPHPSIFYSCCHLAVSHGGSPRPILPISIQSLSCPSSSVEPLSALEPVLVSSKQRGPCAQGSKVGSQVVAGPRPFVGYPGDIHQLSHRLFTDACLMG